MADLRLLPSVDVLLRSDFAKKLIDEYGHEAVSSAIKASVNAARKSALEGAPILSADEIMQNVMQSFQRSASPVKVINGTGIALHTNLGRAPLAQNAVEAINQIAASYANLEFDLETGLRGKREKAAEDMLCQILGCESAFFVNNNAAAVLLALTVMAGKGNAVVSRGELVEIGGSFRVSEIMELCPGNIFEIGTTNRTHLYDYEKAAQNELSALLCKIHTSNYKVVGFTEDVSLKDICKIGKQYDLPVYCDLGSGAMLEKENYSFDEPTVPEALRDGADVVSFSGDKLFGGPQAGIICGKKQWVDKMRSHPLARAMRLDKMTLAALGATIELYKSAELAKREIPVLQMLCTDKKYSFKKANSLKILIENAMPKSVCEVVACTHPVGGGSVPCVELDGYAVCVSQISDIDIVAQKMRTGKNPFVCLIRDGSIIIDTLCIQEDDLQTVAEVLAASAQE